MPESGARSPKLAVFLDTENMAGWLRRDGGQALMDLAAELGDPLIRRAYGNWVSGNITGLQADLTRQGFELVHTWHPIRGKNSADIQLAVDAIDCLRRHPDIDWYLLATGDADFSPVFRRLREAGRQVVGVGHASALSEVVRTSTVRFVTIERDEDRAAAAGQVRGLVEARALTEQALGAFQGEVDIGTLKAKMREVASDFDESNIGFGGFRAFLEAMPDRFALRHVGSAWRATLIGAPLADSAGERDDEALLEEWQLRLKRKPLSWPAVDADTLRAAYAAALALPPAGSSRAAAQESVVLALAPLDPSRAKHAFRALLKAGALVPVQNAGADQVVAAALAPATLLDRYDGQLLARLTSICAETGLPLRLAVAARLLTGPQDAERAARLLREVGPGRVDDGLNDEQPPGVPGS